MWFATKNGVSRYDSYSMVNFTRHGNVGKLIGDESDGLLWYVHDALYGAIDLHAYKYIGYEQADSATTFTKYVLGHHGVWVYDYEHGARFIYCDKNHLAFRDYNEQNKNLPSNSVHRIRISDDGKAWISTSKGLLMADTLGNIRCLASKVESSNNAIVGKMVCFFDKSQRIWLFTQDGKQAGTVSVPMALLNVGSISDVFVWNGQIVMITKEGFFAFEPSQKRVVALDSYDIREGNLLDQFDGNYFVQDKQFNLWVFSNQGKIEKLSLVPNGKFTHAHRRKYMVKPTKDGRFAIATYGNGLFLYQPKDGKLEHFLADDESPLITSNYVERLFVDRQGSIWLNEAFLGISYITSSQTPNVSFALAGEGNHGDWSNNICMVVPTRDGDAMVGTRDNKLYRLDGETHSLKFQRDLDAPAYSYYEDAQGHQWLGTVWTASNGRGLLRNLLAQDGMTLKSQGVTTKEGLANDNVNEMIDDQKGNLWASTDNGLSVISKSDLKAITYILSQASEQNITVSRCGALLSDKTMAFGTLYGVALLNTLEHQRKIDVVHAPSVTDIMVNGKSILADDNLPDFGNGIKLPHDKNTLAFHFSNFDYAARRRNLYQFYLEGIDNTWRTPTALNTAEFGNLSPGTYTLHMRTLGGDNQWSQENTFRITILPPWYNTWVAWLFYLAALAFVVWYVWNNWKEKFDLRQQMKMEKQLTEFRLNFFTHVTHEFRTPLAIIQNAVDKIVSPDGAQISRTNMQTAKRGTRRLLRLVNQLMEFRRISTKNIRLEVERADIVAFVRDICQDFWAVAKQKEQFITFTPFERSYVMLFDSHIVETQCNR